MDKALVCYIIAIVFFALYALLPWLTADTRPAHLTLGGGGALLALGLAFAAEAAT